ncbi:transporter [Halorubellus sp. PRR65]|uniref:transporter n=1 Tax=Halorubellus sp. PRR65 TaxID=3098148 RepID=UPI002B25A3E2|nr:transporter [Halorubellus sp. PRR65]
MAMVEVVVRAIHLVVAAMWVGSVSFFAFGVLPLAREGTLNAAPLERFTERLQVGSRLASVLLLLSGGYMISLAGYEESLLSSTSGHLVLGMVVLWVALTGLVEVGASRVLEGADDLKVRTPAKRATTVLRAATVVGVLLLADAVLIRFAPTLF